MSERVISGSGPSPLDDARTAIVVANELRHALISAVFGGSRSEANLVTAIAAVVALGGVASVAARLGRLRIHHPSLGDAVLERPSRASPRITWPATSRARRPSSAR